MNVFLHLGNMVLRIVNIFIMLCIMFFLFGYAKNYIGDIQRYAYLNHIAIQEQSVTDNVREAIEEYIPTQFAGKDITRPLCIILLLILSSFASSARARITTRLNFIEHQKLYKNTLKKAKHRADSEIVEQLHDKLVALEASNKKNRKQLIKEFVTLKKHIDAMGRELSFLSIDIVDSTGMKKDADPLDIAYDFDHYNIMIKDLISRHHALKFTRTPDGTMVCFDTVDDAVNCAQSILLELSNFNTHVKHTQREFQVRMGINSGFVIYDEDEPLGHLVDRVVDIAAHLQKHADPNSLYIAKHALEPLKQRQGFQDSEKLVDEVPIYTWKG